MKAKDNKPRMHKSGYAIKNLEMERRHVHFRIWTGDRLANRLWVAVRGGTGSGAEGLWSIGRGRAQSAECVLDGRILGEVVLFAGVFGEVVQLFADFDFAAHVGPLRILE